MKARRWAWMLSVVLWAGWTSPASSSQDAGTPSRDAGTKPEPPRRAMVLWLRADEGVVASGGKVSRWKDQSGGGRDGIMDHRPRRPRLQQEALNGRPALHFGGSQSLYLRAPVGPKAFTLFVVGRNTEPSDDDFSMILGPGGNAANNQLRWENGTDVLAMGAGGLPVVTRSTGDTRAWHLLTVHYDGARLSLYRNGNPVGSHAYPARGPWTFSQVGGYYSESFAKADLAEVLIYEEALPGGEREAVERYLENKYRLD
jgi:hypothetical protein